MRLENNNIQCSKHHFDDMHATRVRNAAIEQH